MNRSFALLLPLVACSLAAQSFEDQFRQGLLALGTNDLAQARQHLESASRLKPDNAMVWAALAQTYLRARLAASARDAADRAARLAPPESPVQHALALFYSETGDFPRAAAAERQWATARTADAAAATQAAQFSLRAGETDQAVTWATKALSRGDSPAAHHLLGQAYAALNRPPDALREFRAALERDPLVEAYHFDLAQIQLQTGDFSGAMATLEKACRDFPRSAQLHLAYGVAAYAQRRFSLAIDAFLRVTAIDPAVEQPYVFLARILSQAGDRLPRIVAALAAWEAAQPSNYLAACLHAKALSAADGDTAAIEAKLRRSIQLNNSYWESHFELGVLLGRQADWKQSAVELSRAIALNPTAAAPHFQLARAYEKLGDKPRADAERAEHQRLTAAETGAPKESPQP